MNEINRWTKNLTILNWAESLCSTANKKRKKKKSWSYFVWKYNKFVGAVLICCSWESQLSRLDSIINFCCKCWNHHHLICHHDNYTKYFLNLISCHLSSFLGLVQQFFSLIFLIPSFVHLLVEFLFCFQTFL